MPLAENIGSTSSYTASKIKDNWINIKKYIDQAIELLKKPHYNVYLDRQQIEDITYIFIVFRKLTDKFDYDHSVSEAMIRKMNNYIQEESIAKKLGIDNVQDLLLKLKYYSQIGGLNK